MHLLPQGAVRGSGVRVGYLPQHVRPRQRLYCRLHNGRGADARNGHRIRRPGHQVSV
jgi:hypothetical protein